MDEIIGWICFWLRMVAAHVLPDFVRFWNSSSFIHYFFLVTPFALIPKCCVLSWEAANTIFNVFGLTWPGIKPMTFCTQGELSNHYTTEAVCSCSKSRLVLMCCILRHIFTFIRPLLVLSYRNDFIPYLKNFCYWQSRFVYYNYLASGCFFIIST